MNTSEIAQMFAAGLTARQIAEKTGRSTRTIYSRMQRLRDPEYVRAVGRRNYMNKCEKKRRERTWKPSIAQDKWRQMLDESACTAEYFSTYHGFNYKTVLTWINCSRTPREKNRIKLEDALKKLEKRIEKHPSWGYTTPEQVEKLRTLGIGPERDQLLEQVKKQNDNYGKVYF